MTLTGALMAKLLDRALAIRERVGFDCTNATAWEQQTTLISPEGLAAIGEVACQLVGTAVSLEQTGEWNNAQVIRDMSDKLIAALMTRAEVED